MPSKAEIYARKCEEVVKSCPEEFYFSYNDGSQRTMSFGVSESGDLEINNCSVFPSTSALDLRDWLTDTFDEKGGSGE